MSFREICCQDKAIGHLQRALAVGRVPHAYIFAGLEGVGKNKTAREWGKLLLCKEPTTENENGAAFADNCGVCESCRLIEGDSHPDFHPIYKELVQFTEDGKNKKTPVDLPIDVVREFLINKVLKKPTLSARKVFVVSEAERLNHNSQNALLKVLEEPPEYCCIILLCTRMEKLLATTKSRCRIIRFSPVSEAPIVEKLAAMGMDTNKARYFARLGQGSLGRPCQWAELELADVAIYQTKRKLVSSVVNCKYADSLELAEWFIERSKTIGAAWAELHKTTSKTDINRRAQKTLVHMVIAVLYDVMNVNIGNGEGLINFDQEGEIRRLAGRFDAEHAAARIADAYETLRRIDASVNERLIFEQLLLNLAGSDIIGARH